MSAMRPISKEEEAAILASFKRLRDSVLYLFGRLSGFRARELLSIRVGDFWRGGRFLPEITLARSRLKGGHAIFARRVRSRTVPLHPILKAALQTYLDQRFANGPYDPEAFLFVSRKGDNRPISSGQGWRIIKDAAEACGNSQRVGMHSLRKAFGRDVFEATGHNLVATQHALGHASVQTTTAYLSADAGMITQAILGMVIGEASKPAEVVCAELTPFPMTKASVEA